MAPPYTFYIFETSLSVVTDNAVVLPRILLFKHVKVQNWSAHILTVFMGFEEGG